MTDRWQEGMTATERAFAVTAARRDPLLDRLAKEWVPGKRLGPLQALGLRALERRVVLETTHETNPAYLARDVEDVAFQKDADGHYIHPGEGVLEELSGRAKDWDDRKACDAIANALKAATVYLWTHEMVDTAGALALPRHAVDPKLPHGVMFWQMDLDSWPTEDGGAVDAFLLVATERGFDYVAFKGDQDPKLREYFIDSVRTGDIYPDVTGKIATTVLQMLAFLAIPFVETRKVRQATTKSAKRAGRRLPYEPFVHIVELRAPVNAPPDPKGGSVEWAHRWIVRGHYRAQWYPSRQAHELIWIAPHEKGPEDKPLKPALYAVVR